MDLEIEKKIKKELITEIINVCRANMINQIIENWLDLIFKSIKELLFICHELYIDTSRIMKISKDVKHKK